MPSDFEKAFPLFDLPQGFGQSRFQAVPPKLVQCLPIFRYLNTRLQCTETIIIFLRQNKKCLWRDILVYGSGNMAFAQAGMSLRYSISGEDVIYIPSQFGWHKCLFTWQPSVASQILNIHSDKLGITSTKIWNWFIILLPFKTFLALRFLTCMCPWSIMIIRTYELRHDKTNKMTVRPAKTKISLGIHPVWSESSLSAWRKFGSLATHWAHSEDSDQNGWRPRLIWVFAGRTVIWLVLSCRGSYVALLVVDLQDPYTPTPYCEPFQSDLIHIIFRINSILLNILFTDI